MKVANSRKAPPDDRAVLHCGRLGRRTTSGSRQRRKDASVLVAAAGLLLVVAGAAAAAEIRLPSPLEGPGHPDLKRRDVRRIEKAVAALQTGDHAEASVLAAKARNSAARTLLELQLGVAGPAEPPIEELRHFCAAEGDYAAAWVTFSVAAELAGAEADALASARRVAELWPGSPWASRADELGRRWISDRVVQARELLATGRPDEALDRVDAALALAPLDTESHLTRADILLGLDRVDEAERVLSTMGDDPTALMRRAYIAESRGDLVAAMALYNSVPPGTTGRSDALHRVKLEWRRQNLAGYIQEALTSPSLTRAELAALLVGLVPEAHALGGGQVPLLPDVVGVPSQREILTAVRTGLLEIDRVEQLFHPDRSVTPDEVENAIERLFRELGMQLPQWCSAAAGASSSCVELTSPVSGGVVADIIFRTADGEAP